MNKNMKKNKNGFYTLHLWKIFCEANFNKSRNIVLNRTDFGKKNISYDRKMKLCNINVYIYFVCFLQIKIVFRYFTIFNAMCVFFIKHPRKL